MTASTPAGVRRRRPWLVAAAVGVVVTVIGLAWPDGSATLEKPLTPHVPSGRASPAAPTASGSRPPAVAPESDAASTSAAHTPGASPAGEADLLAIAQEAIAALATCSRDASTACAVWEDASRPLPDGPLVDADAPPALRLLDDYGGVAALRADARDGTAQVVVIVQGPETWLVRDVYDVADQ